MSFDNTVQPSFNRAAFLLNTNFTTPLYSLVPGTVVKVRSIGMMKMIDDGEQDDKVIAVPVSDVDPTYDNVQDISDLPKIQAEQIEMFFKVYKLLPSNRKVVETNGFTNKATAEAEINQALQRYKN